jgi:hypothetical protein
MRGENYYLMCDLQVVYKEPPTTSKSLAACDSSRVFGRSDMQSPGFPSTQGQQNVYQQQQQQQQLPGGKSLMHTPSLAAVRVVCRSCKSAD